MNRWAGNHTVAYLVAGGGVGDCEHDSLPCALVVLCFLPRASLSESLQEPTERGLCLWYVPCQSETRTSCGVWDCEKRVARQQEFNRSVWPIQHDAAVCVCVMYMLMYSFDHVRVKQVQKFVYKVFAVNNTILEMSKIPLRNVCKLPIQMIFLFLESQCNLPAICPIWEIHFTKADKGLLFFFLSSPSSCRWPSSIVFLMQQQSVFWTLSIIFHRFQTQHYQSQHS